MTDLSSKTALITGSTSGIVTSTARALADRGARTLIVGRDEQRAEDVVAEIEGKSGTATYRLATLSDPSFFWLGDATGRPVTAGPATRR